MPRIVLTEVETLLVEQRMHGEQSEAKNIARIGARLRRLENTSFARSASVRAMIAKAHGLKAPAGDTHYTVGPGGLGVLEWDDPKPTVPPPAPTTAAPVESPPGGDSGPAPAEPEAQK